MFRFATPHTSRRPSLTPMIDVVFLLLVFFMLAARFGQEGALTLTLGGGGGTWQGPPRLVEVAPDGVTLNGLAVTDLAQALDQLTKARTDAVVLRAGNGADVQRLVDVMTSLRDQGFRQLIVVE